MKKKLNLLFFSMILIASSISAQDQSRIEKKVLDQKGNLSFISFKGNSKTSLNQANESIKESLGLTNSSFEMIQQKNDKLGFSHDKQQQYHKGIKVEFGQYTLHSKGSNVVSGSGKVFNIKKNNLEAKISKTTGLQLAMNHVGAETYLWEVLENGINYTKPEGELLILPTTEGISTEAKLVYKYDIYSQSPLYRADVYVDAQNGEIVFENQKIHHADTPATGTSLYNDTVSLSADLTGGTYSLESSQFETYDLNETGEFVFRPTSITSSTSSFTNNPEAVQAHWGAEQTYDYYLSQHGRDSFDNNGSVIVSYVSYEKDLVNAFWDGDRMFYGDGNGTTFGPVIALDIVGHELTHGVTQYSANLIYSYESGALNESFSDILGESIEAYAQGGTHDWLLGDEIGIGGSGGAFRSFINPNDHSQPDTYLGTYWTTSSNDSGGVHSNSGVQNFWFYLLSVGGSGTNDNGDSFNVTQIGLETATAIAYRNLTVYLSASSQYNDSRNGSIQAAIDLYGADSTEVIAVTNAWYAVGVGDAYSETDETEEETDNGSGESSDLKYCDSSGSDASFEWIDYVALGGFTNTSGSDGGYADYTSNVASVSLGSTNTITISAGFASTSYTEYWTIWIDLDQSGTFDSDEEMVSGSSSSANNLTASITIPSSASLGSTTMRVSMKYNSDQLSSCETFAYGEVEDYTVNITNTFSLDQTLLVDSNTSSLGYEEAFTLSTYPNPVNDFVQINIKNPNINSSYKIMSLKGLLVKEGSVTSDSIDTSDLSKGIYIFEFNDSQKVTRLKLVKE